VGVSLGKVSHRPLGALLSARATRSAAQARSLSHVDPGRVPYHMAKCFDRRRRRDRPDLGHYDASPGVREPARTTHEAASIRNLAKDGAATISAHHSSHPSRPNAIKDFSREENDDFDFVLVEIGGRVGDIEGPAVFEAIRQLGNNARTSDLHSPDVDAFIPFGRRTQDQTTHHSSRSCVRSAFSPIFFFAARTGKFPRRNGAS